MERLGDIDDGYLVEVDEEAVLVRPARPSPQPWLALSPCDVLMRGVNYTRRVLFYAAPAEYHGGGGGGGDNDEEEERRRRLLQDSLGQALVHFYPLAGRLALRHGRLAVHCNDKGAELVRARIRAGGPSMRQLQASSFSMQPFFCHLAGWASYSRSLHEGSAPLLSIQVTSFPCGGIALGVALSHVIADGTSFWHFMTSWAECARGKAVPSVMPLHMRYLLEERAPVRPPFSKRVSLDVFEDLQDHSASCNREKNIEKSFCVPKEMVEKMKEETRYEYSAYEVVCAHIWKHTNKAWKHPKETKVGFINVVNMRERMEPPLPRGYFGNAILWSIAAAPSGQLNEEDLASTSARIHGAVVGCSSARMHEFLQALQVFNKDCFMDKIRKPLYCNAVRMRVSSSTKFPVASADFGWGPPLASHAASIQESNNVAFFPAHSLHPPGSIAFCLALPQDVMLSLQNDPSFLLYCK